MHFWAKMLTCTQRGMLWPAPSMHGIFFYASIKIKVTFDRWNISNLGTFFLADFRVQFDVAFITSDCHRNGL